MGSCPSANNEQTFWNSLPAGATVLACESPLCLLLKQDGGYLCSSCALHQGNLVVRTYPTGRFATQQFKNGIDAEVVGQVTTILRRLL